MDGNAQLFSNPTRISTKSTHSASATPSILLQGEVDAVQNNVGIMEVSGFNRFELSGTGIHDWLDRLSCSRIPRKAGKVGLIYLLNEDGNVKAEATIANLPDGRMWYGSAAASEFHDMDWLTEHLPDDGSISIRSLTNDWTILVIAGPQSRSVLEAAAPRTDWSAKAFPWLSAKPVHIGSAEAIALSVSFSGELAWELHIPNAQLKLAFDRLQEAGKPFGMKPFGLYATESMRLEKGYRHWKADLITEYNPYESGLDRFVHLDKSFIGKSALLAMQEHPKRRSFVSLIIDTGEAPAQPGDSIIDAEGRVVGTISSAAFGHRVGLNLAMGFVDPGFAAMGTELGIEIVGNVYQARIAEECHYDPKNERVRK